MSNTNPRVAVVGTGRWGKNLVRNFFELNALSAICDADANLLQQAQLLAPNVVSYRDYNAILQKSDIDGVVLATPAVTHAELATSALKANKHVFVEKPLSLSAHSAEQLVSLAQKNNKILMVGHVLEYHPAIIKLRELIASHVLGKIHYIYSNRLNLGTIRTEENILWSFAPHDIAVILRLMNAVPLQVTAAGGTYVQANIPDMTVTHLLFDSGVRAHLFVSWLHPFKEQRLVVIGSKKMASFDDVKKELLVYDQRVELKEGQPIPLRGPGETISFSAEEPLKRECQAFLQAITNNQSPLTDGTSGVRVLKVLEAAQRSLSLNGEPVVVVGGT